MSIDVNNESGTEVDDGESTPTESRRRLLYVTLPGCWGALVFACLSFTPSLLPRGGLLQGLVCGITAAIGYGLGVLAAWVWRAFADRGPRRPSRRAWLVFAVTAVVLFAVAFGFGQYWQHRIRELMGVTEYNIPLAVLSPVIAVLVGTALLGESLTIIQAFGAVAIIGGCILVLDPFPRRGKAIPLPSPAN